MGVTRMLKKFSSRRNLLDSPSEQNQVAENNNKSVLDLQSSFSDPFHHGEKSTKETKDSVLSDCPGEEKRLPLSDISHSANTTLKKLKSPKLDKFSTSSSDVKVKGLGKGVSGAVDLYRGGKSNKLYVIKTYNSREEFENKKEYKSRVLKEYSFLSSMDHINIIKTFNYNTSGSGSVIKIYLEYCVLDLFQLIKKRGLLSENESFCFWKQICNGVNYLHSTGFCHRDLKLENIVLKENGIIKLIDFDTCFNFIDSDRGTHSANSSTNPLTGEYLASGIVGSDSYLAPETIQQIKYDGKLADIWSLGIIFYYMMSTKFPWKSARLSDLHFLSFLEDQTSVTDEFHNLLSPVYNKYDIEIGINAVLRKLPIQSHMIMKKIFTPNPKLRCHIDSLKSDKWFGEIRFCDGVGTCGVDHSNICKYL